MKLFKLIFNWFISFLLLSLIILIMFIANSRTLISKKNISEFITAGDILSVDVNVLFNQEEIGITLKDKIITLALENNIPKKIVDDMLESKQINYLLGDFFNQTVLYIINGEAKPNISDDTISKIKKEASESLENHLNIMISEEELNLYIDNYCTDLAEIIPERSIIIGNFDITFVQSFMNFNAGYLYASLLGILILIGLLNKWYTPLKYLGICMFISGIIFVIIGSMDYPISSLIASNMKGMQPFVLPLITNVLTICFKSGVMVSFSSITILLIYMTITKIYK